MSMRITFNVQLILLLALIAALAPIAMVSNQAIADEKPAAPDGIFEDESAPKSDKGQSKGPLKVGVIISKFTATGPNWIGTPYGYSHAMIAKDLLADDVELYAIVEPETEGDADLATALAEHFPADVPTIDGHDAEQLQSLDVIVGQRVANMNDEMIAAVHEAVRQGTGLVISQTFGTVTPGYRQEICDLFGMKTAGYAFNMTPVACEVLAADPILEGSEDAGVEWQAQPSGTLGELAEGVTVLVNVTDIDSVQVKQNEADTITLPMLYFTHLEKGGIVVSNFKELPDPLKNLEGENFYLRCVRRAASLREE